MNKIDLTEQFMTDEALIKRLKEENDVLRKQYLDVADAVARESNSPGHLCEIARNTRKQLQQAIEKNYAIRLYLLRKGLGNLVDEIDEWGKAHEERIT